MTPASKAPYIIWTTEEEFALYKGNMDRSCISCDLWKVSKNPNNQSCEYFPFSAYSATWERSLFHSSVMNGLEWNICLFEQGGTGINFKVFLCTYRFSLPPSVLVWIHSLWTPCLRHFYIITSFLSINECISIFMLTKDIAITVDFLLPWKLLSDFVGHLLSCQARRGSVVFSFSIWRCKRAFRVAHSHLSFAFLVWFMADMLGPIWSRLIYFCFTRPMCQHSSASFHVCWQIENVVLYLFFDATYRGWLH